MIYNHVQSLGKRQGGRAVRQGGKAAFFCMKEVVKPKKQAVKDKYRVMKECKGKRASEVIDRSDRQRRFRTFPNKFRDAISTSGRNGTATYRSDAWARWM